MTHLLISFKSFKPKLNEKILKTVAHLKRTKTYKKRNKQIWIIIKVLEKSIEKFCAIKIFSCDVPFYSHAISYVIKPLWTPNKNKVTIQIIAGMLLLMAHSTHECDMKKRRVSEYTRWGGLDQGYMTLILFQYYIAHIPLYCSKLIYYVRNWNSFD